jgi:phosphinothricin acetyltransferase
MSGAPPLVRLSRDDDIAAIAAIYGHHVLHGLASFEEVPPSADEIARRRAAIVAGGLPYLVAERDGRVVGYCHASVFRPRAGYRYTLEDSIYIDAALTGLGIGRTLLQSLIPRCTELGYRQMVAVIGGRETIASIRLHRALGFAEIGTLSAVGFKFGRWVDVVLMQRALGDGADGLPE